MISKQAKPKVSSHGTPTGSPGIEGGRIIYALDTGALQALEFPTFWFENTPQGRFMLNIGFGQAKYVVDSLSQNVRRGLREKLRRGEFPGWAPVGYVNDHRSHSIIPHETKAPLVRRAFETYATGLYTAAELRRRITDWGLTSHSGKPIALSKVPVLLSNPFYIGLFRYKGEIHEGVHEAIVSKQVFDRVQEVMRERKRGKYRKEARRPFRGLLTCAECGAAITSEKQKGHHYYRCMQKEGWGCTPCPAFRARSLPPPHPISLRHWSFWARVPNADRIPGRQASGEPRCPRCCHRPRGLRKLAHAGVALVVPACATPRTPRKALFVVAPAGSLAGGAG